jgi:site-specific recombinase XerC
MKYIDQKRKSGEAQFNGLWSSTVKDYLAEWFGQAGIKKKAHMHGFRHSYRMMVYDLTGDIEATRDMMGHANLRSTLVYAHMHSGTKRAIADKL